MVTLAFFIAVAWQAAEATPRVDGGVAEIAMRVRPARAGDGVRVVSTVENRLATKFTVGGATLKQQERNITDTCAFYALLVAAPDGSPPPARVIYGKCSSVAADETGSDEHVPDVSERSYVVTAAHAVKQIDAHGDELPLAREDVAKRVGLDASELVSGARLAPLVDGKTLRGGDVIEVPAPIAKELLGGAVENGEAQCSLTFQGSRSEAGTECAVFAARATITRNDVDDLSLATTYSLGGEILLEKQSGRIVSLALAGPIRVSGSSGRNGTKIEFTATGTLTWNYRAQPFHSP